VTVEEFLKVVTNGTISRKGKYSLFEI